MLFPIKTALSIFGASEITFSRITARLSPCSESDCIRILFTVVIAVSAEEKNDERAISITIAAAWKTIPESKMFHSFLVINNMQWKFSYFPEFLLMDSFKNV